MKTKICKKCNEVKTLDSFYPRKDGKDGYRNECIHCIILKSNRNYLKSKSKRLEQSKCWYYKNKKRKAETSATNYINKKKEYQDRAKRWSLKNKDKCKYYRIKRRELTTVNEYLFCDKYEDTILLMSGFKCFRCGKDIKLCLDHHIPLSKGGQLTPGNVMILCNSCNSRKGNRLPEDFYTEDELYNISILLQKHLIREGY